MVIHYKSHILSFIEFRTSGIYHACSTILRPLDAIQERFCREVGISQEQALHAFNLAPLESRRDMAMLGVIHRTVLGLGPAHLQAFFRRDWDRSSRETRFAVRRHDKQLVDPRGPRFSEQLRRSALGLVAVYNLLPQSVVDAPSVSLFQGQLQSMLRDYALRRADWCGLFSPRMLLFMHPLLRACCLQVVVALT